MTIEEQRSAVIAEEERRATPVARTTPLVGTISGRRLIRNTILYIVSIGLGVMFMMPFAWAVASSLKTPWEMFRFPPPFLPDSPQWGNYLELVRDFPFLTWYWNTTMVVFLATSGVLVTSSMVAYGFARFDFRGRNVLFIITLATIMLPSYVHLIPRFIMFHHIGWLDTLKPLWVPYWFGGTAFGIFLMRQFFRTLPRELDEAALIDGAGYFRIFWNILIPLCKPALAALAIITMVATWNVFLDAVIFLHSSSNFTLAIGIWFFQATPMVDYPTTHLLMAAGVTSILPPIILFFAFQRYFVQGITLTGLKG